MLTILYLLLACDSANKTTNTTSETPSSDTTNIGSQDTSTTESGDSSSDSADTAEATLECEDQLEPALTWFSPVETVPLHGDISFAQTHVIAETENRWAPKLVKHRAMSLLFTPTTTLDETTDLRISAWKQGELIGVLPMSPPEQQPDILEQSLTSQQLEPWSTTVWSAFVPYFWVDTNVEYLIAYEENGILQQRAVVLENLSAPHSFTLSRAKILLFGEDSFDTHTVPATQLTQDFFATLPFAELRFIDSHPWVVDEIVVTGEDGPVLVASEDERVALTTDPDRWIILKLIFTHRMSLANIGQGLVNTNLSGGNSPYSFGTSLGLGWVRNSDGSYSDINNAPYSAGWTGWSSIWHGECGNVFNHEIGHSFTLAHFTAGSASSWGIASEYPLDGENLESHPWGFDTTRNSFRSWYRVNANGIVYKDDGSIQGKRDCMNGGEDANAITCFPQYTGYHGWKIQNWSDSTPTLLDRNGDKGLFVWNQQLQDYDPYQPTQYQPSLTDIDQPTVTIIGSLGATENSNIIYEGMYWPSANQFALPDPQDPSLTDAFDGANYYLKITYQDETTGYAMINHATLEGDNSALFSVNLDLRKSPQTVKLFHSPTAYPNIDYTTATELYTRTLQLPTTFKPLVVAGKGSLANGTITLRERCEANVNCAARTQQSMWREGSDEIYFTIANESPTNCADEGSYSTLTVPVQNDAGESNTATLFAQRIVRTQATSWHTKINDATPWTAQPNREQGIRIWMPYEENQHLSQGQWKGSTNINKHQGNSSTSLTIRIAAEVLSTDRIDVGTPFASEALLAPDSSLYFVVTDPTVGPTSRVWWGTSDPTPLTIPMIDQTTGETKALYLNAWKKTCNLGWGTMWSLNSGQVADTDCTYQVYLELPTTGNEHFISGRNYLSPASQPIVFEGRYWHTPANELAGRFAYQIQYQAP